MSDKPITAADVRHNPEYYLDGPGRAVAEATSCEHGYRLTDSCPNCDGELNTYTVHFVQEVSSTVTVQAKDPDSAIDLALDSPDMPGGITVGVFGSASVDDSEWHAVAVTDERGFEVWEDKD